MPVIAFYNLDDSGTIAEDSALGNGAQNGLYYNGAVSDGVNAVLDGVDDAVKIFNNDVFQMDRGTLEIKFNTAASGSDDTQTVLSRDSAGETDGGFRIERLADGSLQITHESAAGDTFTYNSDAGFAGVGEDVKVSYSWDEASGGHIVLENATTGASETAETPTGLTMDQTSAGMNKNWIVGAGQSTASPDALDNIDSHFAGSVDYFSLSDTVDNPPFYDEDPTANPDCATTDEDTPVTIPVLDNDSDPAGDPLTVTTATAENGTVTINDDGTVTYTPNENYNGPDTITYTITDPGGNTSTSTVAVTVNPVNDDPVANDDIASTDFQTAVTVNVLGNDTDVDGDTLSILGTPVSADGSVTVNGDGTITFTPNDGFSGDATITYEVTDGNGGTDTATVTVTVGEGPARDGYVDGTAGGDLIDVAYTGDPDGDMVDANDALLPGAVGDDDFVRAFDGDDTVYAGAGDDTVNAGSGNDLVYTDAGNDSVGGGYGNDTITTGEGSDLVYGGVDDDVIDTDAPGYQLPDRDYPGLYPADSDPTDDLDTVYGGIGHDTISTGDDADLVYGGSGRDQIDGGLDDDTLMGGQGGDTIVGGEGADLIDGGNDHDLIFGGYDASAPDELNIPDETDLRPDNADDTIMGGEGDDTIFGMDDADVIYGGTNNDVIDGGIDNDTISGDEGRDIITGGHGDDSLSGGDDQDLFLVGSAVDGDGDVIDGGAGGTDYDQLDLTGSGPFRIVDRVTDSDGNGFDGRVEFLDTDGNVTGGLTFTNIEDIVPCFTPGTLIATPRGEVPVEELKAGDRVITRDNGIQPIRWVGAKKMGWQDLSLNPHLKPVLIRRGSLGNGLPERDMMVSPNHRVLVANDRTALYFDEHEVLVAAKHLIAGKGVHEVDSMGTTYIHFMFDRHEVVLSNGAWTESFQPGDMTLKGMGNAQRQEIFELFPDLKTEEGREGYGAARRTLKKHEARLLVK